MALSWVVAGGGTGGHVTPALALAERIRERGEDVVIAGTQQGLEARLVPEAGFELVCLPSAQVMGQGTLGRARSAMRILASVGAARRLLRERNADVVVSVGGYAAMPAALAAITRRTPLVLVEPNAMPGRVNRLTARFAQRIHLGFDGAAEHLAAPRDRIRCSGIPVRQQLLEAFPTDAVRAKPSAPFHLLVFGGSQGARQINDAMIAALPRLSELPLVVFHQAGSADLVRVREAYGKHSIAAEVVAFESDMPSRYRWADLALCRAGALTVAELALAGLPSLLVPYPYAADDHQSANAEALERAGAALRLAGRSRPPLGESQVSEAITALVRAPERLEAMAQAATRCARPDAARAIVEDCAGLLTARR